MNNNNLIVEKCWSIGANDFMIKTNGEYYLIAWDYGKVNPDEMRKVASQDWAQQRAKRVDELPEYMYPIMGLAKESGYNVQVGRAITEQELEELKERLNLSDDAVSAPFEDSVGKSYGKEWTKTFSAVQIAVPLGEALLLEDELKKNGVEAFCGAPGRVNIRIK